MYNTRITFVMAPLNGAITEVILVYDLKAREFSHADAKFSKEICMGKPNSPGMGMPNSLRNFAWGCQIPCSVGDTKTLRGFQNP